MSKTTIAAMLLFVSCSTSPELVPREVVRGEAVRVTICELVAAPESFDGRRVNVLAYVESDGLEHTTLIDESCPAKGVAPYVRENVRDDQDMKALQEAMYRGRPGTIDKRISALFKGVFYWHPKRIPSRVLSLEAVTNLSVEPQN